MTEFVVSCPKNNNCYLGEKFVRKSWTILAQNGQNFVIPNIESHAGNLEFLSERFGSVVDYFLEKLTVNPWSDIGPHQPL